MSGIFISYRRDETAAHAGRIRDRLSSHFGPARVFFDRNTIGPGSDFVSQIEDSVASAEAMVVVIGGQWLTCQDADGKRRLDDPEDFVRREIVAALKRGIPLYPVLVSGARLPARDDLPEALQGIRRHSAVEVTERSFQHDLDCLIEALDAALAGPTSAPTLAPHRLAIGSETEVVRRIDKKVCLIGSFGVGKTSLVRRFVESIFDDRYLTTVGVKIDKKVIAVGSWRVTLMLWDLAGEDEITHLRISNLRGSSGYILVADGLRSGTLEKAFELRRKVEEAVGSVPFVLAVNKSDLRTAWQIRSADIASLSRDWTVFETSAKNGQGVEDVFHDLAEKLVPAGEIQ
jgi:small GTP-binding protein